MDRPRAIGGWGVGFEPDLLTVVNEGQKDVIQARRYIEGTGRRLEEGG